MPEDQITLNKTERMETCLLVQNGIECGLWMAQTDLERHLTGDKKIEQIDIGNLYLLKVAMRTLKKVCIGDKMIKPKKFELYEESIDRLLKDMEDFI